MKGSIGTALQIEHLSAKQRRDQKIGNKIREERKKRIARKKFGLKDAEKVEVPILVKGNK